MKNILPVLTNPEMQTYQQALGIISCLVALDSRTNTSWTLESLYLAITKSVEQGYYQVSCNPLGQPESIRCWKEDREHPYISVNPFAESKSHEPPAHINLDTYDFYRYIGNAFELLSFSDYHKTIHIDYLQREVIPPAWYQQIIVYFDERDFPWAFFSWARISSVIEESIRREKVGLTWADWNCGERLFVNDLAAPWGGSRYVIRDMRERVFPYDKGATAIRRKAEFTSGRNSHFKALREKVRFEPDLKKAITAFIDSPSTFDSYQEVIGLLDEFKSRYELAVLLDQNNTCAAQELEFANELYQQARSALQPVLEAVLAPEEQRAADYLVLEAEVVSVTSAFISDNRLTGQESRVIREWVARAGRQAIPIKASKRNDGNDNDGFNYQQVRDHFRGFVSHYLPNLAVTCEQVMANIQLDLRATVDKIDRPFAKRRGTRLPTYISVPFDGSVEKSIDLIHELSHALLYAVNRQYAGYLFVEDRPLVNEIFAFLGEYLYFAYLKQNKSPLATRVDLAVQVKERYYINDCLPLLEKTLAKSQTEYLADYNASYPVARKLARSLAQQVMEGQPRSIELVDQMCRLGSEFSLGALLVLLLDSEDNEGVEYSADNEVLGC